MNATDRVLAALQGSPEVRPGEAEQLVADLVAETIRDDADAIVTENDRALWATKPGKHWAADLLQRKADAVERKAKYGCETPESHRYGCPCEKDTATRGESTRAKRSALRLAAFIGGAHLGRAGGAR